MLIYLEVSFQQFSFFSVEGRKLAQRAVSNEDSTDTWILLLL